VTGLIANDLTSFVNKGPNNAQNYDDDDNEPGRSRQPIASVTGTAVTPVGLNTKRPSSKRSPRLS